MEENPHDELSHKPISEVLIDMSGCNRKWRRALHDDFICTSDTKNILRVIEYSLHFWCAHTIKICKDGVLILLINIKCSVQCGRIVQPFK